jgi:hypothetical protein
MLCLYRIECMQWQSFVPTAVDVNVLTMGIVDARELTILHIWIELRQFLVLVFGQFVRVLLSGM